MHRTRMIVLAAMLGGVLAGCDSSPSSPFPQTPNPTTPSLAPQVMVLRPSMLAGNVRTDDSTVDAGTRVRS